MKKMIKKKKYIYIYTEFQLDDLTDETEGKKYSNILLENHKNYNDLVFRKP
jgi:hypothetical protein